MTVTFACGHAQSVPTNLSGAPQCVLCGSQQIASVREAEPHISGHGSGPHVQTADLPAVPVTLTK